MEGFTNILGSILWKLRFNQMIFDHILGFEIQIKSELDNIIVFFQDSKGRREEAIYGRGWEAASAS